MDDFYQDDEHGGADDLAPYDASNRYVHSEDEASDDRQVPLEEFISELKARGNSPRPQSAPSGRVGKVRQETAEDTFSPASTRSPPRVQQTFSGEHEVNISESVKIPSSPYDEEVAFEFQPGDDEDLDSAYLDSRRNGGARKGNAVRSASNASETDWVEENRKFLMASVEANIPAAPATSNGRPRPSSAEPGMRRNGMNYSGRPSSAGRLSGSLTARGRTSDVAGAGYRARSSTPKRSRDMLRTSAEKLGAMKELVEDMVRSTVKKADLYHMIQVSLGFIDDYLLIPPRGSIITSKKKPWLTLRDLQSAFMAARLCLNEAQIIILRSLVYAFAQQYDVLYGSSAKNATTEGGDAAITMPVNSDPAPGASGSQSALGKKGVFGPSQTLSATWLKRYLIHLRLSRKASLSTLAAGSVTAASTAAQGSAASATGASTTEVEKTPLAWTDWLGKKMQNEVKRDAVKPKEFEKALNGQPHPLCKEDIELMLKTYNVLPPEILQKEVECRIEAWLLDMDGRRDFQHTLNVKIRHWIWAKKIRDDKVKLPKSEKGYWQIWQKLPEEEKKPVKAEILSTIIQEKRGELLASENQKQAITKELYWKFDTERQKREVKWKTWLNDHIEKFKRDLDEFRATEQDRLRRLAAEQSRRKTVAGLNEVQSQLKKAQNDLQMDAHHQMELQKAINALRRTAMIRGVAKGTVITKEDFDKHIKGILAPYITLDESGQAVENAAPRAATPARSATRNSELQGMFHQELKVAVEKVVELEKERSTKSEQAYQSWLAEKVRAKEELRAKKAAEEEAKKREEEQRVKRNTKAYRKWCQLRRKDQYKSRVDNKPHPVPEARVLSHKDRWNSDKELHEYYAELEKKY